jgi:hypothetical protein
MIMRGILIDPFTRTVREIETGGTLAEIYSTLEVELITVVSVGQEDSLFIDDEGLLVPKEVQEYFYWRGSNQPYAGRGLILGTDDEGENTDTSLTVEDVGRLVTFPDKADIDPAEYCGVTIMAWGR